MSVTFTKQPTYWSLHGPKGILVRINLDDGTHTFGENYEPDEAARVFWEAVRGYQDRKALNEALNDLVNAWEKLAGGHYPGYIIEEWLRVHMTPAINKARKVLGR